jgi:Na+/H+-dicarboxylate symporter
MFRTAVNVTGDLTACMVFNRFYGKIPDLITANLKTTKS